MSNEGMQRFQALLEDAKSSPKAVTFLPAEPSVKENIFTAYPIREDSLLGAVLANAGGIVIDGWLRLYGSGALDFLRRNQSCPIRETVIGEDILGGLFLYLEGGSIGYFAPDTLAVEDMEIGLGQFLYWCLHGDTDTFYADYRWDTWREDCARLPLDQGMGFYPFLWARADQGRTRRPLPMAEIIGLEFDFLRQMS